MKKTIIFLSLVFLSFKDEQKALLQFNKQQYNAVKANFFDALGKIDSAKIALSLLKEDHSKIVEILDKAKKEIIYNGDFVLQIDSVFNKK